VGSALTHSRGTTTPTEAPATYDWLRCADESTDGCVATGQGGGSYLLGDADVGSQMRVRMTVTSTGETAYSEQTTAVRLPPPPPGEPPPPPADAPPPAAPGEPAEPGTPFTFIGTSPGLEAPTATGGVAGERRDSPRLLDYFPVVRIRGFLTSNGVMVQVLSIRAPKNVRITVRCEGRGCPRRSWVRAAAVVRARPFEAILRAGVKLKIFVRRRGNWIGKYTVIKIHRGKAPTRADRCLYPGRSRPAACPSA